MASPPRTPDQEPKTIGGAVEPPRDKRYWRSLDRLLDSPAVREELARELPSGALDPPDAVTRRGVLQLLAASFGMAGLAADTDQAT